MEKKSRCCIIPSYEHYCKDVSSSEESKDAHQIENVEEKKRIASNIRSLVAAINNEIDNANNLGVNVALVQREPMSAKSSHLSLLCVDERIRY